MDVKLNKCDTCLEIIKDTNANQHNPNALNDVGQHKNALEGDAISRQAVLALPRNKIRNFKGEVVNETIKVTDIETLPSVNPQEQKPCEDCISRQAAIDAVNIGNLHPGIVGALQSILADLPPVTPKQEPCEDAISRQAMHIELEKWITYGEYKYSNATKYLYDRIDRLPSVTPQPKTGHWIYTGYVCQTDEIIYGYGCSKCGAISFFRKSDNKILGGKWCHYCGAGMVEPQESEG